MAPGKARLVEEVVYPDGCKELAGDIGKDEIIKRLVRIAKEFQEMGQEDNSKYRGLALYLASEFFMDHPNKDVRLLTACCLADIFRIFAPDAPFADAGHLKTIFEFLVQQLRGLEDTEAVSFKRYFYLLENLAWVKSFNICIELEESQEIFTTLFKIMFSIVSPNHTHKVKAFMLDMMCPLITESDVVSQDLLDTILVNIIEPNKSLNKEANNLAKEIIKRTANAIEPFIQIFFNNCLLLGKTSESEVSDHMYALIYELNTIAPSVLLAVLPQLEYKLKSNDEEERKMLTRLLAKMFSDKDSELALTNKPLWQCFLGRFNDINVPVRTVCVQSVQHFILNQPDLMADILPHLSARLHDQEECVRFDAVTTIVNAAKKNIASVPSNVLELLKERVRDKKFKIRKESLVGLGQLYKKELMKESREQSELNRIGWIRSKILHGYYQPNMDDRIQVERMFKLCLVPYTMDGETRMKTLYELFSDLDDHAVKAMKEMLRCQNTVVVLVRQMLELLKGEQNNDTKEKMQAKILQISRNLPDQSRMHEHMKRFFNIVRDDARIRKHLAMLVGQEISCKKAEECVKEILKKMGNPTPQNVFYTCIKTFLERIAPVLVDADSMKVLIGLVRDCMDGDVRTVCDPQGDRGRQLLMMISTIQPGAFDSVENFSLLNELLDHESDRVVEMVLQVLANTHARIQKHEAIYDELLPKLEAISKQGSPKQAKHAIICIKNMCRERDATLTALVEDLKAELRETSCDHLLTVLVAMGHIAQIGPQEISAGLKPTIVQHVVKNLLLNDQYHGEETDEEWWDNDRISDETRRKSEFVYFLAMIQAMKLMCRWCLGLKGHKMADTNGPSTLKMFNTVILHGGDILQANMINKPERNRLRVQAACCMLKMAQEPVYAKQMTQEQFHTLAYLMADPCPEIRATLSSKLHKGLLSLRLPLQYMAIFALAAPETKSDNRDPERTALQQNITKRREYIKQAPNNTAMFNFLPDYVLPYAVHLLAHHPDLVTSSTLDALRRIKECLWFLLEPLITKTDSYSYTFYRQILENIKHRKDAMDPDNEETNKKLYAVCDLTVALLTTKSSNFVLKDLPIEPSLPEKLFVKADENFINNKVYLPKSLNFTPPRRKGTAALMPKQLTSPSLDQSKSDKSLNGEVNETTDESALDESQVSENNNKTTTSRTKNGTNSRKSSADERPSILLSDDSEAASKKVPPKKRAAVKRAAAEAKMAELAEKSATNSEEDTEDRAAKVQALKKTVQGLKQTKLKVIRGGRKDAKVNGEQTSSENEKVSSDDSAEKENKEQTKKKNVMKKKEDVITKEAKPRGRAKKIVDSETSQDEENDTQSTNKSQKQQPTKPRKNSAKLTKTMSPVKRKDGDSPMRSSYSSLLASSPRKAILESAVRGKKRPSSTESPPPAKKSKEDGEEVKKGKGKKKDEEVTTKKATGKRKLLETPDTTPSSSPSKRSQSQSSTASSPAKRGRGRPPRVVDSSVDSSPAKSSPPVKNIRKAPAKKLVNGTDSSQMSSLGSPKKSKPALKKAAAKESAKSEVKTNTRRTSRR